MSIPVIAIFDIGKTNKKLILFDKSYRIIFEKTATLPEGKDEDGDDCESLDQLINFIHESLQEVLLYKYYDLKAINFSAYGASLVNVGYNGKPVGPLYNYLKQFPANIQRQFYDRYGGPEDFSLSTASPVLGSLNSGMQLYRMKQERPALFSQTKYAVHLPQFLSYIISGKPYSEITSIGCHTGLWDFASNQYHRWLKEERLEEKLAPIVSSSHVTHVVYDGHPLITGIGLHDSSAALIPYLKTFKEPFVLLSTGTWCISMNPFNDTPLSGDELKQDCLCYLTYSGKPVKSSRLFSGFEYEQQVKRIAAYYNKGLRYYQSMRFDPEIIKRIQNSYPVVGGAKESRFALCDLAGFSNDAEAYHALMFDLVQQQHRSTQLVLRGTNVTHILVDGGFSKNNVFMNLMASFFPGQQIYAASMSQGTALGSALVIHDAWNDQEVSDSLINLTRYDRKELVV
ncbi:MAG TPA: FGGY family carbohydrate kinase [Ohtaekwangia sp.]|nr:FGGY family carbohydrate kinase [Ohtaekwangia sp.]